MKLLIAGDFSPRARGQHLLDSKSNFELFGDVKDLVSCYDYSIVNFETNISTEDSKPIQKYGPNLTTTPEAVELIKYLGFNVVTLANNHFYDYGDNAICNTLSILDKFAIHYVGGGRDVREASKTLFLQKNDESLAIINACEHEFSIAGEHHGGAYGIDVIQIYHDIQVAKTKADYVLVIIHGGHEHFQLPSLRMQDWYRFFIEVGADAVVNHHQHCFSGMELYQGKPIYYGLGNFFFDLPTQKKRTPWNEGILLDLEFSKDNITHRPIPFIQFENEPTINILGDYSDFLCKFERLNSIILDRVLLEKEISKFYAKTQRGFTCILEPYMGRIFRSAYYRKLLPSLISKNKILSLLNLTECESHIDRLKFNLKSRLK